MNIDQELVNKFFMYKIGDGGEYTNKDSIQYIQNVIKTNLNIELSYAETHNFWTWRSELWDAGFLDVGVDRQEDIVDHFKRMIEEFDRDE